MRRVDSVLAAMPMQLRRLRILCLARRCKRDDLHRRRGWVEWMVKGWGLGAGGCVEVGVDGLFQLPKLILISPAVTNPPLGAHSSRPDARANILWADVSVNFRGRISRAKFF